MKIFASKRVICAVLHWGHATLRLFQVVIQVIQLKRSRQKSNGSNVAMGSEDVNSKHQGLSTVWKNQRSQLGVVRIVRSCIWCFESLINLKRLECTLVRRKPQDPEAYRQLPGMKRHVGHVMTLSDSKTAKNQIMMRHDWHDWWISMNKHGKQWGRDDLYKDHFCDSSFSTSPLSHSCPCPFCTYMNNRYEMYICCTSFVVFFLLFYRPCLTVFQIHGTQVMQGDSRRGVRLRTDKQISNHQAP